MDEQLTLELEIPVSYKKYSGKCTCGHIWEYTRCNIVLEMTVPCPNCKSIIKVGETKTA